MLSRIGQMGREGVVNPGHRGRGLFGTPGQGGREGLGFGHAWTGGRGGSRNN